MVNKKEIRWGQRFENFEQACALLDNHIDADTSHELAHAGFIQLFEMAIELAWKFMKDYLEAQGYKINNLKEAIKEAFQSKIVDDGQVWLDALEDRRLTFETQNKILIFSPADGKTQRIFLSVGFFHPLEKNILALLSEGLQPPPAIAPATAAAG